MFIEETVTITKKEYERLLSLEKLVLQLQEEIRLLKNGKKSSTSHTAPSHDIGKSNRHSLRKKTGKKTGGQKGHKGSTLKMTETPDEIIEHHSVHCTSCSSTLNTEQSVLIERKQEIVIHPIKPLYLEHRAYSTSCLICGHNNIATLPTHLKSAIQYGSSVSSTIAYLFAFQYLPYNRIKTMMYDFFGLNLSEGTIDNLLAKTTEQAMPMYENIQQRIAQSTIVGGDETGTKINGKKAWFHVWQNRTLTFIVSAMTRGYATTETYFMNGFIYAIYVSDCWSGQLKTPAKKHQLCLAHLLRELTNFEQALQCSWSIKCKLLLQKAIKLKQSFTTADYLDPPIEIKEIKDELDKLLLVDESNSFHPKPKAFIKRLQKHKDSVFTFLDYEIVPYDNNGSERAVRNVKVKNKISGSFRSEQGATRFAVLRSVIDTTIKNSQDVFNTLNLLPKFVAE